MRQENQHKHVARGRALRTRIYDHDHDSYHGSRKKGGVRGALAAHVEVRWAGRRVPAARFYGAALRAVERRGRGAHVGAERAPRLPARAVPGPVSGQCAVARAAARRAARAARGGRWAARPAGAGLRRWRPDVMSMVMIEFKSQFERGGFILILSHFAVAARWTR